MKIVITGASGLVGSYIAREAEAMGHAVTRLARPAYQLGDRPDLRGHDALIHAAFSHIRGRYRGGEGDDPEGFLRANLDGSLALFEAARQGGIGRVLFLSSRAVHDGHPEGMDLPDDLPPAPTSLYGEVKARTEAALAAMAGPDFRTASLRPTGVFGAGVQGTSAPQKWAGLIRDFLAGQKLPSRVATEVHGADLGQAALLALGDPDFGGSYNVSDLVLDHYELLAGIAALTGTASRPPLRGDPSLLRIPVCARLAALGWEPRGLEHLHADLPEILAQSVNPPTLPA